MEVLHQNQRQQARCTQRRNLLRLNMTDDFNIHSFYGISSIAVRMQSQTNLHKLLYPKMVILNTGMLLPLPGISGGNIRVQITTMNIWQERCKEMFTKLEKYNMKHVSHIWTVHVWGHPPTERLTDQPTDQHTNQPINKQTNIKHEELKRLRAGILSLPITKNTIETHALLNYNVSFYARVMFLKDVAKTEHKIPI
jgi:hypothetical protein